MSDDYFDEHRSWNDIHDSCGLENRSAIKLKAREDFGFFLKHVLGANTDSPLIQDLIDVVQNPPDQSGKSTKIAIEAARGHSKTFTATIARTLWTCYRGFVESADGSRQEGAEILIVSASQRQSTDILQQMKRILLRNDALDHLPAKTDVMEEAGGDYAIDDSEKEWAAESFTTTTDVRVRCKPFRSGIRGKHVDLVLMDDILSPDGARTIEQEKDLFYSDFSPIVENKGGTLQVVGTPRAHNGLLEELIEKDSYWTAEYPALIDGEPMWPFLWTEKALEEKKEEIGPARFAREYMCRPVSKGEQFFPYDRAIAPNIDHDEEHFRIDPTLERYNEWEFFGGFDIAMADSADSDYAVFTVLGRSPDGEVFLVDQRRQRGLGPEQIVDEIEHLHQTYGFIEAFVEDNAIGQGVWKTIERRDLDGVISSYTTGRTNRKKLLSDLQAALYRNDLKIPDNDALIDEMLGFKLRNGKLKGKDHDDTVMALAFAWKAIDDTAGGSVSATIISHDGDVSTEAYEEGDPETEDEDFSAVIV